MWKRFGLKDLDASCIHPCSVDDKDDNQSESSHRRLWFCSDFSHLVKNLRNFMMSHEEMWVRIALHINFSIINNVIQF